MLHGGLEAGPRPAFVAERAPAVVAAARPRAASWLAHVLGTAAMLVRSLPTASLAAEIRIDTYRDAQGIHRFSNVARPGWKPFVIDAPVRPAEPSAPPTSERDYERIIHESAERYRLEPALLK